MTEPKAITMNPYFLLFSLLVFALPHQTATLMPEGARQAVRRPRMGGTYKRGEQDTICQDSLCPLHPLSQSMSTNVLFTWKPLKTRESYYGSRSVAGFLRLDSRSVSSRMMDMAVQQLNYTHNTIQYNTGGIFWAGIYFIILNQMCVNVGQQLV